MPHSRRSASGSGSRREVSRVRSPQHRPGGDGQAPLLRHEHHRSKLLGRGQRDRPGTAGLPPGDREPSQQAGGDIVRVPLQFGGQPQHRRLIQAQLPTGHQGTAQHQPGHDRRRRRAQAAGLGNPVVTGQPQPRRAGCVQCGQRREGRPHHQVGIVGGQLAGPLTSHLHRDPRLVGDLQLHLVVEVQGQPERIEPGSEVRARGRYPHHRSHPHLRCQRPVTRAF
jgi:hypothetical protein